MLKDSPSGGLSVFLIVICLYRTVLHAWVCDVCAAFHGCGPLIGHTKFCMLVACGFAACVIQTCLLLHANESSVL